jgi:hypothetical protein
MRGAQLLSGVQQRRVQQPCNRQVASRATGLALLAVKQRFSQSLPVTQYSQPAATQKGQVAIAQL